ncbi:MAG: choloylglycine hydrolase family protein [Phycisphaerales bacterium]|nr:choloylglycine hydrolase family protein [Phycisphaerales bacterium]
MSRQFMILSCLFTAVLAACRLSMACTQVQVTAKDASVVVGRTMEFAVDLDSHIITSPIGRTFQSPSPTKAKGLAWTAKHGYLLVDFFGTGRAVDGMNMQGLSVGLLYLPGYTQYQEVPAGREKDGLNYLFVADWVLGNFATVGEVKAAIDDVFVYGSAESLGGMKNQIFPIHMVVADAAGKNIIVEWVGGKTNVYDNPLGVLTNSPEFPWQLNNLKNYVNLTPYAPDPVKVGGVAYAATGQGAGALGLPGDFTPPSRFVKMAYLVDTALEVDTAVEAVVLVEHILNNADIPDGAVRSTEGGKGTLTDITRWSVFKDLKDLKFYYKSYTNTTLQEIDMKELDFSKGAKQLSMRLDSKQIMVDATDRFQHSGSSK